jgi:IS30 family transposase
MPIAPGWGGGSNENTNRLLRQYFPERRDQAVIVVRQTHHLEDG